MVNIELIQDDITTVEADAIVNAANSSLAGGGGVDGAIHRAAGPSLLEECMQIAKARRPESPCSAGEAVITGAGKLNAKYVIHTVGPVWHGGFKGEAEMLASCYRKSLLLAEEKGIESIAFPNISTGVYGYPKEKAANAAVTAVREVLSQLKNIRRIIFVCFDRENYLLYSKLGVRSGEAGQFPILRNNC
jgi:O-acetyl-ADP-ribose deacetylase (regulator of RNase III)